MSETMPLADVGEFTRRVEALGFDGIRVPETVHDSLSVATLSVEHSEQIDVGTAVTIAFPRSPMVVALAAWDLHRWSEGRFQLGLGTQVRGNIEGRFATSWSAPVARMRDYISSLRAIWDSFQTGKGLRHETENYRFTRLQPFFNPGPCASSHVPIVLGGVNRAMCELAGEVADGLITHPTNSSPRYLTDAVLPATNAGSIRSGRGPDSLDVVAMVQLIAGRTRGEVDAEREAKRESFAFLWSTPAYQGSLKALGREERGEQLHAFTREGRWDEMPRLVDDEMLDAVAPAGLYGELGEVLLGRYADLVSGLILFPSEHREHDSELAALVKDLHSRG